MDLTCPCTCFRALLIVKRSKPGSFLIVLNFLNKRLRASEHVSELLRDFGTKLANKLESCTSVKWRETSKPGNQFTLVKKAAWYLKTSALSLNDFNTEYTFQHAKRTGIFPYWARFYFLHRNFVFSFICISVLPPGNDRYAFCRNCLLFYKCKMWLILERKQSSTIQGQNVLRCERNWRHQDKRTKRRLLQKIANVFFFFFLEREQ